MARDKPGHDKSSRLGIPAKACLEPPHEPNPPPPRELLQQGLFHHRQGDIAQAMERYTEVLRNDPKNADALYYIAVVACQDGQFQQGVDLARRAIAVGPPQARMHNLLGQALYRLGEPAGGDQEFRPGDRARRQFRRRPRQPRQRPGRCRLSRRGAEKFRPRARAQSDVGDRLAQPRRPCCSRSAATRKRWRASTRRSCAARDVPEAHVNRGNALKDLGQFDAAAGQTDSARFGEADASYTKAIAIDPKLDPAFLGRGLLRLLRGDWEAGFADYEHRENVGEPTFIALPQPRWDGEVRAGERVVLVSEQGLGDTIQFCRFAPLLAARGFDVTILTRKAMAPLLATLAGVTIATDADALAQDPRPLRWLPLLSVPGVLGIRPDSVPAAVPYLSAEPERVEAWRARLGGGFKIGINWASGHSD